MPKRGARGLFGESAQSGEICFGRKTSAKWINSKRWRETYQTEKGNLEAAVGREKGRQHTREKGSEPAIFLPDRKHQLSSGPFLAQEPQVRRLFGLVLVGSFCPVLNSLLYSHWMRCDFWFFMEPLGGWREGEVLFPWMLLSQLPACTGAESPPEIRLLWSLPGSGTFCMVPATGRVSGKGIASGISSESWAANRSVNRIHKTQLCSIKALGNCGIHCLMWIFRLRSFKKDSIRSW